jgi:hypothetical protein
VAPFRPFWESLSCRRLRREGSCAKSVILEGEFKPGPLGPGGRITGTDRHEWMEGGCFLAGHSDFKSSEGDGSSLAVMGYNPQGGVYTYDAYNSIGDAEHAKGVLFPETWIWTAHVKVGSKDTQSRFLIKMLTAASYSFQYVMSEDGIKRTVSNGQPSWKEKQAR